MLTLRRLYALLALGVHAVALGAQPQASYVVRVDSAHPEAIAVEMRITGAVDAVRLAMMVHPEYDAKYWRNLEALTVDGTRDDRAARVDRLDSTLWRVTLPGGSGRVRYTLRVPRDAAGDRNAWRVFVRPTGALLNPPDIFLYLPDAVASPATVKLEVPSSWRVATALATAGRGTWRARDAATLLDSPILLGALRSWDFREGDATFHVHYWPLPDATPFDTAAFVRVLRRLTHETTALFGGGPARDFHFLLQDGANDALEHAASVTIGVPSAALAADSLTHAQEIAHEFFHSWNLVAIHPREYDGPRFVPPERTSGLWLGEGVTMYYADALRRRAALTDPLSRADRVAAWLRSYLGSAWAGIVSPEQASLAFGDSPVDNAFATGGYYVQGQLLAVALDALVRDSTRDARGLDDVLRALYARRGGAGYTSASVEGVADTVCGCRLAAFFTEHVRGPAPIDLRPAFARLGLDLLIDTVAAVDERGAPQPDLRVGVDFGRTAPPVVLVVSNPASAWSRAGLRTGDTLTYFNGAAIASPLAFVQKLRSLHVGDSVSVFMQRARIGPALVQFRLGGYDAPRVRIVEQPGATAVQKARRERWLAGW